MKQNFIAIPEHKSLYNIGATLDVPTGMWVPGYHGESILMGGLGPMIAVAGPGKMFKSTFAHYMLLSALNRITLGILATIKDWNTSASTYDSETNIHVTRLRRFAQMFEAFKTTDILSNGTWVVSDAGAYLADEWYAVLRDFMRSKRKEAKKYMVELPLKDKDGKRMTELFPTFSELDSLSAMHLSAGEEIMNKGDIGDSKTSHVFMREGLGKAQMLHELPSLATAARHYVISTVHIGANNTMNSGPGNAPPKKQLQFLPTDTKLKGISGQFLYNQHVLWLVTNCKVLWNDSDKTTLYPKVQGGGVEMDTDLNLISTQILRSNAGPGGAKLDIVVSQQEGVLPSLTEFRLLKDNKSWGFQGNDTNYQLVLMPEVNLRRTTIRENLDTNKSLERAMNLTSELLQMHQYHKAFHEDDLMSAEDLYAGVTKQGYDWKQLIDTTRGWWTYNNDIATDRYFLSTLDFLRMARGKYHPYWMEDDKRTVKKAFLRKTD